MTPRPRRAPGRRIAAVALLVALAIPAHAYIPRASRVTAAIARANRDAGRTQAIKLDVSMRIGDGDTVGAGELLIHPTGLARLELRGASDLLERHLLLGTEHTASRNGRPLSRPRSFLPPLFFLQASSPSTLAAALQSFGVELDLIGLAPCGESDCYVLGDPERVPPPRYVVRPPGHYTSVEEARGAEPAPEAFPRPVRPQGDGRLRLVGPAATVWVDIESYEWKKIEAASGVVVWLGPLAVFDKLRVPSWILIEEPDRRPVRFEVLRATPVNAPAAAFSKSWLLAPVPPPETPPADAADPARERLPSGAGEEPREF